VAIRHIFEDMTKFTTRLAIHNVTDDRQTEATL